MRTGFYIMCLCFFISNSLFSQNLISVNSSSDPKSLIEDYLISGCGIALCEADSPVNAFVAGEAFSSFGAFSKNNSNFPFDDGIILTTGNVIEAGNAPVANLNAGGNSWGTDPDLNTTLGISDTRNATTLEFEFVAITNTIAFDYILASEEYNSPNVCSYADGFAFLIQEEGNSNFKNIALIPDSTTPVNTVNINGNSCAGDNIQFYENEVAQLGNTNFYGRTKVLTAQASITPYKKYKIKLIVADHGDTNYDTAVFIKGSSFNTSVDLGEDITDTCTSITLNADIGNSYITNYNWYKDGVRITDGGAPYNKAQYTVTESGTYSIQINVPQPDCINGVSTTNACPISDEVTIAFKPATSVDIDPNQDFSRCSSEDEVFNLQDYNSYITSQIRNEIPDTGYTISYFDSNDNPITSPITLGPGDSKLIKASVLGDSYACTVNLEFTLMVNPQPTVPDNIRAFRCDNDLNFSLHSLDALFAPTNTDDYIITYHYTEYQADEGIKPIPDPYRNINTLDLLYVRVEDKITGCAGTNDFYLEQTESPKINNSDSSVIAGCQLTTDGIIEDLDEALAAILDGLNPNDYDITYYRSQEDADNNVNEITDIEDYLATSPSVVYVKVTDKNNPNACPSVAQIDIFPDVLIAFENNLQNYATCGGSTFNMVEIANDISEGINDIIITFYDDNTYTSEIPKSENYTIPDLNGDGVPEKLQTIYIQIEYPGCMSIKSDFEIFEAPDLVYSTDGLKECSSPPVLDLDYYNTLIDYTSKGYKIDYYLTQTDLDLNQNKLPQYIDSNTIVAEGGLYVKVTQNVSAVSLQGICFDTFFFPVEIIQLPEVNITYDTFRYCVTDPALEINLSDIVNDITLNTVPETVNIKLYENQNDAVSGNNNYIQDPNTYYTPSKTIYSRVTNVRDTTSCAVIDPVKIEVYLQPEIDKTSFFACDTPDFKIGDIDRNELLVNYSSDINVSFYTEKGGQLLRNDDVVNVANGPQTIYVIAKNNSNPACAIVESAITLNTIISPVYNIVDIPVCIIADSANTTIDLEQTADEIEGDATLDITFYKTEADANARINQLNSTYTIQTSPTLQNIWARIENAGITDCYKVQPLLIKINELPDFSSATIAPACATNYDGDNVHFDLTQAVKSINLNPRQVLEEYYFESLEDVANIQDPTNITTNIPDPENYIKPANITEVFLAVFDAATYCYTIQPIALNTTLPPPTKDLSDFQFCEDGTGTLNLTTIDNRLVYDLNAVTVSYYSTYSDAETASNPLVSPYVYTPNETLYARVQSNDTGCYIIKTFNLLPYSNPNGSNLTVTADATSFSEANTITVSASGGSGDYVYSLDQGAPQTSNTFNQVNIGEHTVTVKDISGCAIGSTVVQVINIPKFFTPNSDGFHDTWHIIGVEHIPGTVVFVFDRYGKLMTTLDADATGWNGTYRGQPMPTDDYWYVADIIQNNKSFQVKGHFTLKR
ncbi:choice-of-anchor L domain-containing protein [Formosa sp. A9]|uniref:choice-of-anchor L domain-containing protein n=1 Tax=Formosa sp. A9 TaxID=3442641 RepID=UPI003EB8A27B